MNNEYEFDAVARLPLPGDNVAIATRRLEAGTRISDGERQYQLSATILEGHRFAVRPIAQGAPLLSWELPFGIATRSIAPGEYVCNDAIIEALSVRNLDFELPAVGNFEDRIEPFALDTERFQPAEQIACYTQQRYFAGYRRTGARGVGTRNVIVLLGITSRTASFVKQLEERTRHLALDYTNIDGIVAVAHTEGGSGEPNNRELLLQTLAGFAVHPNVGAVLAVDYGVEPITNEDLRAFLYSHDYPIDALPHAFFSLAGPFLENLARCEEIIGEWLPVVNRNQRTQEPIANLKIALQCGGSDAFSGISGNPLAAWVAREIIRYGGAANLAETDELIGAESYVLQRVVNLATAQQFLYVVERFKERVAWHGHSAEGNPSGGNKFRGLYNIVLKSIGAAMKKHPDVRLDGVLDYGERMQEPGYYFMDSPGNDLESIAGQVASGCNVIYFVTGNGSITNFPFVPTIKIVTTSRRYKLLESDMDVNAGAYLDGTSMDELGEQTLDLTLDVVSGQRSVGERAGHAQVQIWRDWRQTDASHLDELLARPEPAGHSLPIFAPDLLPDVKLPVLQVANGFALDQIGLILPTSLCAGQIAQLAARRLNERGIGSQSGITRYVALAHTEGCGTSGGASEALYIQTMLGYMAHPSVGHCLMLEHGCEKTHNDYMRHQMAQMGLDLTDFGWASVQLDGGIASTLDKIERWFDERSVGVSRPQRVEANVGALRLGLASNGEISDHAAKLLSTVTRAVVHAGGTVVIPENATLLANPLFRSQTVAQATIRPTVSYGCSTRTPGLHIMETPTVHWVETLTGLAATGVEILITHVDIHPLQAHPMIPMLQVTDNQNTWQRYGEDLDLLLQETDDEALPDMLLGLVAKVVDGSYKPHQMQAGNIDFQLTRGLLGVSM